MDIQRLSPLSNQRLDRLRKILDEQSQKNKVVALPNQKNEIEAAPVPVINAAEKIASTELNRIVKGYHIDSIA